MNVVSIQSLAVPPPPHVRRNARSRGGAIAIGRSNGDPALYKGARRFAQLEEKIFGIESKEWSEEVTEELRYLASSKGKEEHAETCKAILAGLNRQGLDAATRARHDDEKLADPPANEPILIRRVTVPPEGLFLEEAVDKVPWVNRCLNIKSLNIASVPIRTMRRQDGDNPAVPDDDSPTARQLMRLIERPNAHQSGADLIEAIDMWMNVRQALVWMMWEPRRAETKPDEAKGKLPAALYCLPAHRCVGMMWGGSLLYYRVTGAGGLSIPAWQVIRLGFYNPKEEFRCLSPLSAAYQVADTDYAMDLYNSNIFENGLKLSGVVSFKGEVSEEKRITYENLMRQFAGVGNAHAVLVLDQEASFESMVSGTKDMDYKGLAEANKNKLTGEFGVPRAMLGDMEGSRSLASATVSRKTFWQDTLVPELRKIVDKLNVHLVPYANDRDLFLEEDLSKVEALSEDRTEFATAFLQVSQGLVALAGIQYVNQDDASNLLEDRFGIQVQGETPEDTYEEDEEIMAEENAAVVLIGKLKGLVLDRMKLNPALGFEAVPQGRVVRLAQRHGMKIAHAKEFAKFFAKTIEAFEGDTEKVAEYFDGLKIIADRHVQKKLVK